MWLGSYSNSWQSCMVEMHSVNRHFVKVRIIFSLDFRVRISRKQENEELILYSYVCVVVIGQLKYRTDTITKTKGWKHLPVFSSPGNHIL